MALNDLKVLLVGTVPPPAGGDATWALEYLEYCKQYGYKARLVNTSLLGKRAITADNSWNLFDEIRRCNSIWGNLRKEIHEFKPDIVHMNISCSPFGIIRDYISSIIVKKSNTPLIIHCHCTIEDQIGSHRISIMSFKKLVKNSRKILVLNSRSLKYVHSLGQTSVKVLPNFIKPEQIRASKDIQSDIKKVLFVGYVRKSKGVGELISAAREFPNIEFTFAGQITHDYSREALIQEAPTNVHFLGAVLSSRVTELLDESDVFILPTYTEGFSVAVLEAMARGVPIISTDVGANSDMLENSGGYLVSVGSATEIVEAIRAIEPREVRKQMSERSINKVYSAYTVDKVMMDLRDIYREIYDENT